MDNELKVVSNQLPTTVEDLSKFVAVGRENLVALQAQLRAVEKVGEAEQYRQQLLEEAQDVADTLLLAEVRLGELISELPETPGKRTDLEPEDSGVQKSKREVLKEMGLAIKTAQRYELLASHQDIVLKIQKESRNKGKIVSRASVLKEISKSRRPNDEKSALKASVVQVYESKEDERCVFQACKELHEAFLGGVDSPAAQAVVNFFRQWDPAQAREHEALKPYLEELMGGGNLVFDYQLQYVQKYPEIQAVWDKHFAAVDENVKARCLVTGEMSPVAVLHPNVKGVAGGQPTGTALVSFNASAFESYGHDGEQGRNAPVSEKAAFAYTSALNYMITEKGHHIRLSDTTIVFWAEHGQDAYAQEFIGMMGEENGISEEDLLQSLKHLAAGCKANLNDFELDPEEHFYVLGLSPNAARLSVRFFMQDSFGIFAQNLLQHHERLRIVTPAFDNRIALSFWQLLNETVNQKSREKMPSPLLSGALVRAVLMNQPYPRLLLDQVEIRIRAEREINRGRAAIIKAYLLKQNEIAKLDQNCEEALNVKLNEETTYQPYLLGRLFAVLEALQQTANPGINATIRDRYFNSACATPSIVFPQLIKLAQTG